MNWLWIAFVETATDHGMAWWSTPPERSAAVKSCVERVRNLGECLAQAGAMQAMYDAGRGNAWEGDWVPNREGRPCPGWGEG